jgi:hypothetical protein
VVGGEPQNQCLLPWVEAYGVALIEGSEVVQDVVGCQRVGGGMVGVVEESLLGVEEVLGGVAGGAVLDEHVLSGRTPDHRGRRLVQHRFEGDTVRSEQGGRRQS